MRGTMLRWSACLAVLLGAGAAQAAPVTFTLEVSPISGTLGDTFVATVELQVGGSQTAEDFVPPDFPGFSIVDAQLNQTTSVDIDPVSGQRQLRTVEVRRYLLRATRLGHHTLGPARARIGGQEQESNQRIVDVVPAAPVLGDPDPTAPGGVGAPGYRRPQPTGRPDVFLHAAVDRTDPWPGEQVTVTWLLFTRAEVVRIMPEPPRLDDLWAEKLYDFDTDLRYFIEEIDGESYRVAILAKRALFPTRSGRIEIRPYQAKVAAGYSGSMAEVTAPVIPLDVKPLPPGAPPGFDPTWVGEWSAEAEIDRDEIQAGEGVTLTLRVRGTGALGRVATPSLSLAGFRVRAPRDREQRMDVSTSRVGGELLFRYWVVPEKGGQQSLPAVRLAYFNPRTGAYQLAETRPLPLMVRGDPAAVGGDPDDHFIAPDIRLLHDGTTIGSVSAAPLHRRPWFWVLALLPPLGFAGLLVWQRMRGGGAGGRVRTRRRLRDAALHLRGNRAAQFFAELARVLDERLGQALGQSPRALTRPQLAARLAERGFDGELIQRISDELDNCDFARFTPAASAPEEMRAALERTEVLVDDIDRAAADARDRAQAEAEAEA